MSIHSWSLKCFSYARRLQQVVILIYLMRKHSQRQQVSLPRVPAHPHDQNGPYRPLVPPNLSSTLEKYQTQISERETPTVHFKVNRKYSRVQKTERDQPEKTAIPELDILTRDIRQLRLDLHRKESAANSRFGRLVTEMAERTRHAPALSPPLPQQTIYYPVPMPYPLYLPPNQQQSNASERRNRFVGRLMAGRVRSNLRRWRKVSNCILFIILLRRFCRVALFRRRILFGQFMGKIKAHLGVVRKQMSEALAPLLTILLEKREVDFGLQEEESKSVRREKVESLRKMLYLVLQCLLEWAKRGEKSPQLVESLYFLCKHGSMAPTEPLLTREQLQISCLSSSGYLSADCHLQKAALITLIFIKLLLFNTLLAPEKIHPQLAELPIKTSITYEFVLDYQDELLLQTPSSYKLGNYQFVGKARVLESIVMKGGEYRQGELISGLKEETWVKQHFGIKSWSEERKLLKKLMEELRLMIANFHRKLISAYF